jgi:hypothetical protein
MASRRMEEHEGVQENGEGNVGKGWHHGSARRTEFQVDGFEARTIVVTLECELGTIIKIREEVDELLLLVSV